MMHDLQATHTHRGTQLTCNDRCLRRTYVASSSSGACTGCHRDWVRRAPSAPKVTHRGRRNTQLIRPNGLRSRSGTHTLGVVTPNGAAIRSIREARGLSLRRLARLIERSPGFLSHIETEDDGASPETLGRIATSLAVPIEAITREKPRDQEDRPGPCN
ncbi:helix-turn-helix domain-containing protein [Streptomyces sp. ms191]|uniref:helix-turn-helix domain-containing protein n=1 Tax=Streptomyces sp. ms191 TaxID=1827978 RepID=UPI0011CE3E57|nr:helix-turn-helix domain-containing protein [Streptomyces sp. ms191]